MPHGSQLLRLREIMSQLRRECEWDHAQTHESLVRHLIEETAEAVEEIETTKSPEGLKEELGDLLLQVYFHSEIASERDDFDIEDVAEGVCDKLERRHPWIFAGDDQPATDDMMSTWEQAKTAEKRRESCMDDIPNALSTLAKTAKAVARADHMRVDVAMASEPITETQVGEEILALVQRAHASGIDADQATRRALRQFESDVRKAER